MFHWILYYLIEGGLSSAFSVCCWSCSKYDSSHNIDELVRWPCHFDSWKYWLKTQEPEPEPYILSGHEHYNSVRVPADSITCSTHTRIHARTHAHTHARTHAHTLLAAAESEHSSTCVLVHSSIHNINIITCSQEVTDLLNHRWRYDNNDQVFMIVSDDWVM